MIPPIDPSTSAVAPSTSAPEDPRGCITPEDLNVAPALLGLPLASPWQRAKAMAVDATLVTALSNFGNAPLLGGCCWVAWRWYKFQCASRGEVMREVGWRGWLGWVPALCLVAFGLYTSTMEHIDEPTKQARREAAAAAAVSVSDGPGQEAREPSDRVEQDGGAQRKADRARIEALQREVRELRDEAKRSPIEMFRHWWEVVGLNLAWAFVYFVAFPLIWPGQTPGKRLMGLRIVELTGKPLKPMLCVRRYGGYAAGATTGGMGFLQILWDANRQGLHDKAAHTAVIDTRNPRRLPLTD